MERLVSSLAEADLMVNGSHICACFFGKCASFIQGIMGLKGYTRNLMCIPERETK